MITKDDFGISIIIPTYNRVDLLIRVLQALEKQSIKLNIFEVIVVDDGSTDETELAVMLFLKNTPLELRYYYQTNKKQGAARNLGIRKARQPILLFIGDDILPHKNFIESHVNFYRHLEKPHMSAVIGYTTWPVDMRVTPFMKYIGEYGHQFGYSIINGNGPLRFNFYYTSNLLLPVSALNLLEHWFDEDFDGYGWEDIELGFRLENAGVNLFYNPGAVGYHHHPVNVSSFCKRQQNVGKTSSVFLKKHPQLSGFLGNLELLKDRSKLYYKAILYEKIIGFLDQYFYVKVPQRIYDFILDTHYAKGAIDYYGQKSVTPSKDS